MRIPMGSSHSSLAKIDPIARADYQIFQHYMFNMGSRHLLNCISENFNLENFSGGACARNSLEKCAVSSPDGRYRVHIATVYCISRPPISQNPPPPLYRDFKDSFDNLVYGHVLLKLLLFVMFRLPTSFFPGEDLAISAE